MPNLRVPYTSPFPTPTTIPRSAGTVGGAATALRAFLGPVGSGRAVVLTGAGVSVESGLSDYRGVNGTYRRNRAFRPIFFHEFVTGHDLRARYWARSFLGWPVLAAARPNRVHRAIARLGQVGLVGSVITQNVDGFHQTAHPDLATVAMHGSLPRVVCLTCRTVSSRGQFQARLAALNPSWMPLLETDVLTGPVEDGRMKSARLVRTANPDGDAEIGGIEYRTFRVPACDVCVAARPAGKTIFTDSDGALRPSSDAAILKPDIVMFGENIRPENRIAAEGAVQSAGKLLVVGSSLAAHSAWRLVNMARESGIPIGILNVGGVRAEADFMAPSATSTDGRDAFRCSLEAGDVLDQLVRIVEVETDR